MSRARFRVDPEHIRELIGMTEGTSKRLAHRAWILILSDRGLTADEIAKDLGLGPPTVYKWRRRYAEQGLAGLHDLPRPGQPHRLSPEKRKAIEDLVNEALPSDALDWSIRRLARAADVTEHQARVVLESSRPPPPPDPPEQRDEAHKATRLGGICIAPTVLAGVLLVDSSSGRHAPGLSLGLTTSRRLRRPTHYRNNPRSLYRAFDTASSVTLDRDAQLGHLTELMRHVERTAPGQGLTIVIAPASVLPSARRLLSDGRSKIVSVSAVSAWLAALENYLMSVERDRDAPATKRSEVDALRAALVRHNEPFAGQEGAPFSWCNPNLCSMGSPR